MKKRVSQENSVEVRQGNKILCNRNGESDVLAVHQYETIRQAYYVEKKSIRQISRVYGHSYWFDARTPVLHPIPASPPLCTPKPDPSPMPIHVPHLAGRPVTFVLSEDRYRLLRIEQFWEVDTDR